MLLRACVLTALALCVLHGGEAILRLRAEVRLSVPRATVADVAEIVADDDVRARIAGLVVAELPTLAAVAVDARLLTAIAARAAAPARLRIEGACQVARLPRTYAAADLVAAAVATQPAGTRCTLLRTGAALVVPDGPGLSLLATPLDRVVTGEVAYRIQAMEDGRESGRTLLVVRLDREDEIVVAVRDIPAGDVIQPQDLRRERRTVDRQSAGAAVDPATLSGGVARRPIRAGEPVAPSLVARPPAVRSGATVAVVWRGDGFDVEVQAVALGDARTGERVGLRRIGDGALLRGLVQGDGTVVAER